MLVVPTDRWLNQTIRVPFVGRVARNGKEPVDVSEQAARWLITNCFAKPADGATEQPVTQVNQDRSTVTPTESDYEEPTPEAWQQRVVEFINTNDVEPIAAIDGISHKTAETLVAAKPLDFAQLEQTLTKTQVAALRKWAESQS